MGGEPEEQGKGPSVLGVRVQGPTVVGLPTRDPEQYVSRKQLAERMGVSVQTVDRMVRAGMPSVTWGRRTRRFLPSVAMAWAKAQERNAA